MAVEDDSPLIQLDDELDGDVVGSRDYRFCRIGESVPIRDAEFDPQCLPRQPLVFSERFRLLFVAHPQGFCVVRTKDVIASANEIKENGTGPSVGEMSLVDVHIGQVSILALAVDDSCLAAVVDSHVHFFAVSALLHKEQKPSYTVSLDDSSPIKDMRWSTKGAKVYVILSSDGKLYHGSGQGPLSCVMENVDAVDWSVKGNFVAVAKKNTLSILSLQFKKLFSFLLQFKSVAGDSDVNQVIKVDSVRWIRPDCIAVGCFQLNEDDEVEAYIVQIITSKGQSITDAASKPIVLSFNNVFMDYSFDVVPARSGQHLLLSYLNLLGVAFIATRNLSLNVGLFSWSMENGNNEPAMVDILNDAWTLRIDDSQDNGEENVLLGLCVDNVDQDENVKFTLGNEEKEVSPCCVIISLTIDGKISVFHFASAVGPLSLPVPDEEDHAAQASMSRDDEESKEQTTLKSASHTLSMAGIGKAEAKATFTNDLPTLHANVKSEEQTTTKDMGQKPAEYFQNLEMDEPKKPLSVTTTPYSNAEKNSLSEVKSSDGIFSHKFLGDSSSQSMERYPKSMGQKPAENFQNLKVDEPKKPLSLMPIQDSNVEKQSSSEVKSSPGLFSHKYVGNFSSQSMVKNPQSGYNLEPFSKDPSKDSQGAWSSTWSNDASKASAGRFVSLPSDPAGSSNKLALPSTGGLPDPSTALKGNIKSFPAFASVGQTTSTALGNRHSASSYPVPQVSKDDTVSSEKFLKSESKKESVAASSPSGFPYSAHNAPKQFGNVEEMAKKLDTLLEGIEGKGGFIDSCIRSQENLVMKLEDGIWALSDRCKMWRGLLDDQSREVQSLLNKTMQVLVRKVYMEGIFKQATDSRYWELWNRQKLSSELELKRRCILDLNQELTNQLIELERHFNSLEFNKFGENGGVQRSRRVMQSYGGHSREIQSLYSLRNTMTAQLAAAEQLSGCLSEQMAVLSIESSGKHDAKKQLFESIGLSYAGESHRSPGRDSTPGTPSNKEQFITSCSVATKEQSRRNQATVTKSHEAESARRRRDSLDRSWAAFEPPKTTVNRMLLKEDSMKGSANRSMLNIDGQRLTPQLRKNSGAAYLSTSEVPLNHDKSEGTANAEKGYNGTPSTSFFQRKAGLLDDVSSTISYTALPPQSTLETTAMRNSESRTSELADEKFTNSQTFTRKDDYFAGFNSKFSQQSSSSFNLVSSLSTLSPEPSLTPPSHSTESFSRSKMEFPTTEYQKNTRLVTANTSPELKFPVTSASGFSSALSASDRSSFTIRSEKPSQPSGLPASTPLQSVFGSPSLSTGTLPALASFVSKPSEPTLSRVPSSNHASPVGKQDASQSQAFAPSTLGFTSNLSLSTAQSSLSPVTPSTIAQPESPASVSQPSVATYGTTTEDTPQSTTVKDAKMQSSASQPVVAIATPDLNLGLSSPTTSTELITKSNSGSQIALKSSSIATSPVNSEQPRPSEVLSSVASSNDENIGNLKNVVPDASLEEEMEEEAPESDRTTEIAFGNLGGFGFGSSPSSNTANAPRPNPFGVAAPTNNMASASSPFTLSTPTGELFRPASFNLQSPHPPQPSQPTPTVSSGGFGAGIPGQVSGFSGFGQPANIGAGQQALGSAPKVSGFSGFGQPANMGAGQQALGSVLGTFGQSRQVGVNLGGGNAAPGSGFGGGSGGGFSSAATGGGFANLAAGSGGFAAAATSGGGFAAAAGAGGGFAAAGTGGGGFGAFNQQGRGGGGFSAFGGSSGHSGAGKPSELFTQMRR